ncbi:hypothetical protein JCM12294_46010 [Desulfocicer niacini]
MYAEHKSIALKSLTIEFVHNRTNQKQYPSMSNKGERPDTIDGYIELEGDLDKA